MSARRTTPDASRTRANRYLKEAPRASKNVKISGKAPRDALVRGACEDEQFNPNPAPRVHSPAETRLDSPALEMPQQEHASEQPEGGEALSNVVVGGLQQCEVYCCGRVLSSLDFFAAWLRFRAYASDHTVVTWLWRSPAG